MLLVVLSSLSQDYKANGTREFKALIPSPLPSDGTLTNASNMSDTPPKKEADYDPEVQVMQNSDEAIMAKLGYKQELKRDLTLLQVCFSYFISFSILIFL